MRLLFCLLILLMVGSVYSQSAIKATTFNIRYATEDDNENAWSKRKNEVADYLIKSNADFIGIQEALWHQVSFLDQQLTNYSFVGVGRDDGDKAGEAMVIFYNNQNWSLIDENTSWLSETSDKPSKGWDAACNRTITEAIFENKKGDNIHVINTHFDHQGEIARTKSVEILRQKISNIRTPYILLGDFNFDPKSKLHKSMSSFTDDTYDLASENTSDYIGTYNGFNTKEEVTRRIDYIFLDREYFKVNSYHSASDKTKSGHYLSDHFPVTVELSLTKKPYFKYSQHKKDGKSLNYRIMYPVDFDESQQYPLLVFLHGSGERGSDNRKQLVHGSKLFIDSIQQYPAIVIFPQCPKDDYWAVLDRKRLDNGSLNFDFIIDTEPTESLDLVISLIDSEVNKKYIDNERLYVGGLSMGGFGTFELLWRIPAKIAAAMPICGGGSPKKATEMTEIPIWMFHGAKDNVVHPRYSVRMLYAIQRAGGKAKITIYPEANHNSWDSAFADEAFFSWLFSKNKD